MEPQVPLLKDFWLPWEKVLHIVSNYFILSDHSSSDRRAERTCAHGVLNCTVLLEFNTFQSQLTLLFYTACLFSYFSCSWAVCL